jgi:predicted nucleic acid-binding protein
LSAISEAVPAGATILLDTSVLMAHLGRTERLPPIATELVEGCLVSGRNDGAISTVTVSELLVRPHRDGREAVDTILGFLWSIPDLLIRSVDFLVAAEAASIRASRVVSFPDSLIIATGVLIGADVLATNDRRLATAARGGTSGIDVLVLGDLDG